MTTELKIIVMGTSASGKSALAELVRQALTISGINVELTDDNGIGIVDEKPGVIAASLDSRIKGIADRGTPVKIQTMQVSQWGGVKQP